MQKTLEKLYSLKDLCNQLSISNATGKNWIKLNKITPSKIIDGIPYFEENYLKNFKKQLSSQDNSLLKHRRNKKFVSGSSVYSGYISTDSQNLQTIQKIVQILTKNNDLVKYLNLILAECAIQLFAQKFKIKTSTKSELLNLYLQKSIDLGKFSPLIDDLIGEDKNSIILSNKELFNVKYEYKNCEDILGFLYISCQNINNRKAGGAYYTPTDTVKILIKNLIANNNSYKNKRLLEPCCGTGNFLLQLPKDYPLNNIFAYDIDEIGVKLARINLALKYSNCELELLYKNIKQCDFLESTETNFDYILGNPPWGADFSEKQKSKYKNIFKCATDNNIEAYDLFVEHSINKLNKFGILSFVLPQAILNVKTHRKIREILLEKTSITYINYLGNVFNKVQCPSIILQTHKTEEKDATIGTHVVSKDTDFIIKTERNLNSDSINLLINDCEYEILNKILNGTNYKYLKNNAIFALGIVTGNNKKYITQTKNKDNEIILKGSDIYKYGISPSQNYITYKPEEFQQVAPTGIYRAKEKLLYKFISNKLVFAYDNSQKLTLNSCNLLIPKIETLQIKYILAILNSQIAQFIFKKSFMSVKVLRSHLEQIPIPDVSIATQNEIIEKVDAIISSKQNQQTQSLIDELDKKIAKLYNLTQEEYSIIKTSS